MSEVLRNEPEVLEFNDRQWRLWCLIPTIDDKYRGLNAALEYTSVITAGLTRVVFQHSTDNPDNYIFSSGPERDGSYEIYDLTVDRADESGKLQVTSYIGEIPGLYEEGQAKEWAKFQGDIGMRAPDDRNKKHFQGFLKFFYAKYMIEHR